MVATVITTTDPVGVDVRPERTRRVPRSRSGLKRVEVPDLDPVAGTDHGDRACSVESRQVAKRFRDGDPELGVHLHRAGIGGEAEELPTPLRPTLQFAFLFDRKLLLKGLFRPDSNLDSRRQGQKRAGRGGSRERRRAARYGACRRV